ncbi:hypothetical protein FOA52_015255, partial [Chlamydomonas sp. UWO 241]
MPLSTIRLAKRSKKTGLCATRRVVDTGAARRMVVQSIAPPEAPSSAASSASSGAAAAAAAGAAPQPLCCSPPPATRLRAYIEAPPIIPSDGVLSSSTISYTNGVWHGMVAMAGFEAGSVPARVWKKELGLFRLSKDASRLLASRLFPAMAPLLLLKKHHGRAEALLIAAWALGVRADADGSVWFGPVRSCVASDAYGNAHDTTNGRAMPSAAAAGTGTSASIDGAETTGRGGARPCGFDTAPGWVTDAQGLHDAALAAKAARADAVAAALAARRARAGGRGRARRVACAAAVLAIEEGAVSGEGGGEAPAVLEACEAAGAGSSATARSRQQLRASSCTGAYTDLLSRLSRGPGGGALRALHGFSGRAVQRQEDQEYALRFFAFHASSSAAPPFGAWGSRLSMKVFLDRELADKTKELSEQEAARMEARFE